MKKTIISTNIQSNTNIEILESVKEVQELLEEKGNYILLTKLHFDNKVSNILLRKSTIKLVKMQ